MTLTRQHFQAIADTIADRHKLTGWDMDKQTDVARAFAFDLRMTNPNFDRARFLKACGVEGA